VRLKLEYVYWPCILAAKKKYAGTAYESPDGPGAFVAKGIETVRRDGVPFLSRVVRECLVILFDTRDLSLLARHLMSAVRDAYEGRLPLSQFVFSREVRDLATYASATLPPAAQVARAAAAADPGLRLLRGWRHPYVIVCPRTPAPRQADCVADPRLLLADPSVRLHTRYYIDRLLRPALQRFLGLLGVSLSAWFSHHVPPPLALAHRVDAVQRVGMARIAGAGSRAFGAQETLDTFLTPGVCAGCGGDGRDGQDVVVRGGASLAAIDEARSRRSHHGAGSRAMPPWADAGQQQSKDVARDASPSLLLGRLCRACASHPTTMLVSTSSAAAATTATADRLATVCRACVGGGCGPAGPGVLGDVEDLVSVDDLDAAQVEDRLIGCESVACDVRHARLHAGRAAANQRATVRLVEGLVGGTRAEQEDVLAAAGEGWNVNGGLLRW